MFVAVIVFAAAQALREAAREKNDGELQPLAGVDGHDLDTRQARIDGLEVRIAAVGAGGGDLSASR